MSTPAPPSRSRSDALTEMDVWGTADKLLAEGRTPTNRAVLHTLGRGSMGTVADHMRAWRHRQEAAAPAAPLLSDKVTLRIGEAIAEQVAAGRAELEALLAQGDETTQDLIEENGRLAGEIDTLTARVGELEQALSACEARTEVAEAAGTAADTAMAREREASETARIAAAQAQLKAETLEQSVTAGRDERSTLAARLDKAEQRVADAEREAAVASERADGLARARDALDATRESLVRDLEAAREQATAYLDERTALAERTASLDAQIKALEAARDVQSDARSSAEAAAAEADRERRSLAERAAALEAQAKGLEATLAAQSQARDQAESTAARERERADQLLADLRTTRSAS